MPKMTGPVPVTRRHRWAGRSFDTAFLAYLACTTAFGREFAHLHLTVGGAPLFVGELTLLALTLLAVAVHGPRRVLPRKLDFASAGLLVVLAFGAFLAVKGLAAGFGLAALRDFAMVYYAWFFFLTRAYLRQGGTPRRILGALLAGALAGSFVTAARFIVSPALVWGHGTAGHNALDAWVAIIILLAATSAAHALAAKMATVAAVSVCIFVMYISGYRTLLAVVAVSLGAITLLATRRGAALSRRFVGALWVSAAVLGAVVVIPRLAIPQTNRFVDRNGPVPIGDALASVAYRWTSDVYGLWLGHSSRGPLVDETGSLSFRSNAWRHAAQRILGSPWTGIGFGPPAVLFPASDCDTAPSPTSNCGAAHNTYLMLAMRMGIPAALLVCAILGWLLARSAAALTDSAHLPRADQVLTSAALAFLSFLVFGATSLLFESPYLASVAWVLAGVTAHLTTGATGGEPLR